MFMADYEQGDIGHDLFRVVRRIGLEAIVSKHRGRACRSDRCKATGATSGTARIKITAG
jgi:hypothetical protein